MGTRGDDREKRNHYRDTMAVWTAILGWGAAGGLLLLAWGDFLLLALLLMLLPHLVRAYRPVPRCHLYLQDQPPG